MYKMNADEARALMLETEAEILRLLRHFEQETGLTAAGLSIEHGPRYVGQNPHKQQPLLRVLLEAVLI